MHNLSGKNILLLMPCFYNYQDILIEELRKRGAKVKFVENKLYPLDPASPVCKMRLLRKVIYFIFDLRWRLLKSKLDFSIKYDILICVNGFLFDKKLINKLKEKNQKIKTILYLWDSTNMFEWNGITKYFDKSFTFDPLDAKKLNIHYLPNFYPILSDESKEGETIYDLFFVGTQHADRYDVIRKIIHKIPDANSYIKLLIRYKHILHSKFVYNIFKYFSFSFTEGYIKNYNLFERFYKDDFLIYHPLNAETVAKNMEKSHCILDIQAPSQVGLTHQAVRALAEGKKLVTVNSWMQNYDFYNPDYILIIDRENPIINVDFLKEKLPNKQLSKSILDSRVDNWVNIILS